MIEQAKRQLFFGMGLVSLFLGLISLFVPLIPAAPFVIIAAFLFSRSNKKFHNYLREHRHFGAGIRRWEDHGVISLTVKLWATAAVGASLVMPFIFIVKTWGFRVFLLAAGAAILVFIWTRPSKVD